MECVIPEGFHMYRHLRLAPPLTRGNNRVGIIWQRVQLQQEGHFSNKRGSGQEIVPLASVSSQSQAPSYIHIYIGLCLTNVTMEKLPHLNFSFNIYQGLMKGPSTNTQNALSIYAYRFKLFYWNTILYLDSCFGSGAFCLTIVIKN